MVLSKTGLRYLRVPGDEDATVAGAGVEAQGHIEGMRPAKTRPTIDSSNHPAAAWCYVQDGHLWLLFRHTRNGNSTHDGKAMPMCNGNKI
jgi:hypothetical protein